MVIFIRCKTVTIPLLILGVLLIISPPGQSLAQQQRDYLLATANKAGTFYPVGVALDTLTKLKIAPHHNLSLTAMSSAGSRENLHLLRDNQAQFAILQGLYGYWAWNGVGQFSLEGPQKHLRSITMLWQNVEHFAVRSDFVKTGTVDDLQEMKGKTLSIGSKQSGSAGSGHHILQALGLVSEKHFDIVHLNYGKSAEAMQKGEIDIMNIPGGPPVTAISRAFTSLGKDITVLNFTEDHLKRTNQQYDLWSRFVIHSYTYPGQDKPITTIAQPNFLAVRQDIPEEDVYLILKAIYENLPFLHNIHPTTRAMKMSSAIQGLPIPLHPGAARFYREHGIDIPDRLIVP